MLRKMSKPEHHLGLLLIDFQDCFLKVIPNNDRLLKRTAFAIEAANLLGCSLMVAEQLPEKLGPTTAELQKHFPNKTPILAKSTFSVMNNQSFSEWIGRNQIEHLLLMGLETPICIYQTAIQALSEGIGVTVLSDCIGERRFEDRDPTLRQLLAMDAHVLPAETIFYSLVASADHRHFHAFTDLVKKYAV